MKFIMKFRRERETKYIDQLLAENRMLKQENEQLKKQCAELKEKIRLSRTTLDFLDSLIKK